jgi:hypothetical protein
VQVKVYTLLISLGVHELGWAVGQMARIDFAVAAGTFLLLPCLVQEAIQFDGCFQLPSYR